MPRSALIADLPSIASLYHSVWHETHSSFAPEPERRRRTIKFFLDRMGCLLPTTLVEERKDGLAGFVSWHGTVIGQLYVVEACRGSGVADVLLSASERAMAESGVIEAELHCVVGNHRARRFYERNGWTHHGTITKPVAGPDGDVPIMLWRMVKWVSA